MREKKGYRYEKTVYAVNGNKNVFSFRLKLSNDFWPPNSRLGSFQIRGPAELNARDAIWNNRLYR